MKIGILTFHRSINYGAVTQCYALVERLKKDFPNAEVEVIDYIPAFRAKSYKPTVRNYILRSTSRRNPLITNIKVIVSKVFDLLRYPQNYKKEKRRYDAFKQSMSILPLSKQYYETDDYESFRKSIKGKYDVIISGSDCVWKWGSVPFPNVYYMPGDYGAVKMSYAAAFGTEDFNTVTDTTKTGSAEAIRSFSYVGVRDVNAEYNVHGLCPDVKTNHNCDPTTLLDSSTLMQYREIVRDKLQKMGMTFDKPVIGIMGNEIIGELAHKIFGDTVTYVGVYVPNKFCDYFLEDLKVLEWASSFGLFDLTFTTFFHGTMLSLVNATPVLTFDYYGVKGSEQKTKLIDLYERLDLPEFYHLGKKHYNDEDVRRIGQKAKFLLTNPPRYRIKSALAKESASYNSFHDALESIINGGNRATN